MGLEGTFVGMGWGWKYLEGYFCFGGGGSKCK